jgi:carbamoyl-phosphate synthase large subunit
VTTIAGAKSTALALKAMRAGPLEQVPLQQYFPDYRDDSNYLMVGLAKPTVAAEAPARR